ncbi:peptidoglycan-binding domain-containing protein [Streptomyces adelaidensis]|uniref:peptidoglycan-binding domain-containing protein n=1 Tax=Streptomyces adelaidensis TaxID=2796465 RepID=UPI001908A315|nr:peptidoglycan-binding protein [Streptomyces adelaidensis]
MTSRRRIALAFTTAVVGAGLAVAPTASAAPAQSAQNVQAAAFSCGYYSGTALTKANQTGAAAAARIKEVQCLINYNTSYPTWLNEDGDFGTATYNAVRSVQSHAGISVDGQVGSVTWGKLRAGVWW